jgi:plasmid stabilization system protein ParE
LATRLAIRVVHRAAREIAEVDVWRQKNRPDAPDAIREEIERAFYLISSQPKVGARAVSAGLQEVRRVHLARIGYHLYYRTTSSAIEVLAVWHSSRGSRARIVAAASWYLRRYMHQAVSTMKMVILTAGRSFRSPDPARESNGHSRRR